MRMFATLNISRFKEKQKEEIKRIRSLYLTMYKRGRGLDKI